MRAQPFLVAESAARVQEGGARDAATPAVLQLDVVKLFKRGSSTGRVATCTPRPHHSQLLLAMRRARRHLPLRPLPRRRPAGCLSVVDSRLCAGPGATCPSARFLARRLAGCFSVVDSRFARRCCRAPGPAAPAGPRPRTAAVRGELTPQLCVCAGYAQGPAPPAPPPASPPAAAFACLPA
eukprot:tig00021435_g21419.t1